MSNPTFIEIIKVDGTDYMAVHTDEDTLFVYPLTYEGPVPSIGQALHALSPRRRSVVAALCASEEG